MSVFLLIFKIWLIGLRYNLFNNTLEFGMTVPPLLRYGK